MVEASLFNFVFAARSRNVRLLFQDFRVSRFRLLCRSSSSILFTLQSSFLSRVNLLTSRLVMVLLVQSRLTSAVLPVTSSSARLLLSHEKSSSAVQLLMSRD